MAQIIKHRRGSIDTLVSATAKKGELIIATGSVGNMSGPWVFVGETEGSAGAFRGLSKIYQGAAVPNLTVGTWGSTLNGTPFYSSNDKTLYILSNAGNTDIDLTGNIEGNTISGLTINKLTGDLRLAGDLYMTGNTYQTGSHYLTGDVILSGSINIGDNVTGDTINFNGEVNSNILPTTGATFNLGSSGKTWNNIFAENAYLSNLEIDNITLNSLSLPGNLTVSGTTTLSGSVYVEDLTEKRLVVAGANGLLTNYSGLTFNNGNLNVSGALEVTNIQGTGSLYLKPDLNDSRLFEIYNTAAPSGYTDIHFLGNADFNFFGDDTNYLKIDDTAQTVTIDSTNGIFLDSNTKVNGTLIVTGTTSLQNTLTVTGTTIIHGNETVNGILTVTGNTQLGGNLYVSGTLEVLGSSTEVHIQSNTVEINDNIILLNAYSPFERYAGIALYDSGSTGESGSFLWDSLNNYFLMNNNSVSSKVIGTTTNTLGNENSLTSTYFPIATADNTIGNSLLRYSGTTLSFNTNKFTVDSSSGNVYVDGNVRVNGAGGSNYTGYTSEIVFKNSDDDLGFVSVTDTQTVTTQLLGYQSSDGTLVFSSLIDGGSY
jgi:cytoskeletal protein CcmA (bactofilin family)